MSGVSEPELCLFVLWDKARPCADRILADLRRRFVLQSVREIHWTPRLAARNFDRFYADLDVRGVYHALSKGKRPFLAITVVDPEPRAEERWTSRGRRRVNGNFLDAKEQYREWAGKLTVHCTETAWETERDLVMLLGVEARRHLAATVADRAWNGAIETVRRDLTGARGWASAAEMFEVLNVSVAYVVLGTDDAPPSAWLATSTADVDLLAGDYSALHRILGTGLHPRATPRNGGLFRITIGGQRVALGLRDAGDPSLDAERAREVLASRTLCEYGYYRPADGHRSGLPLLSERARPAPSARVRGLARPLQEAYWRMYDGTLLRAPWIRKAKHWLRG